MIFSRIRIGQRLYIVFAAVLLMLAAMSTLSYFSIEASQAATERIVEMDKRTAQTVEWLQGT